MAPAITILSLFSLVLSFYQAALCYAAPELFDATRGLAPAMVIRSANARLAGHSGRGQQRRSIILPELVSSPECAHACAPIEFAISEATCIHDMNCVCGVITALGLQQCWQCAISSARAASTSSTIGSTGATSTAPTDTKRPHKRHSTTPIQPTTLAHQPEPSTEETALKEAAVAALHDYAFACSAAGTQIPLAFELDGVFLSAPSTSSPFGTATSASPVTTVVQTTSTSTDLPLTSGRPNLKPNGWLVPDNAAASLGAHISTGLLVTGTLPLVLALLY